MAPVWRAVFPESKRLKTSSRLSTSHSFTPHRTAEGKKSTGKHFLIPSKQACGQESSRNKVGSYLHRRFTEYHNWDCAIIKFIQVDASISNA